MNEQRNDIVRRNLMHQQGYSPYCGDSRCAFNMPRTTFKPEYGQFFCRCGWVSGFPSNFIARYMAKWGIKKVGK